MAEAPRPEPQDAYVARPAGPPKRNGGPPVAAAVIAFAVLFGIGLYTAAGHAPPAGGHSGAAPDAPPPAATAAAPAPVPALAPAASAPPASRLAQCRPYAQFAAALKSGSESDAELVDDAACLCSLAGGFVARNLDGGIQPYVFIPSCPAGSVERPLEPDAKVWMGSWIDEPGHHACACYRDIHAVQAVSVKGWSRR
jgi:hypothetical protein